MRIVGLAVAVLLAGSCSTTPAARPSALGVPPTTVSPAATVDPSQASFFLTVSNQSFREQRVAITVEIDGHRVIAQDFDVEGQHNFVGFPLSIKPGRHVITSRASSRTTHRATFEIPESGKRYGVLLYWNEGTAAPYFSWQFQSEQPAFA